MNLPNLPTDNLYKFLAITGLILILISVIYPEMETHEIDRMLKETKTELNILKREEEYLNLERRLLLEDNQAQTNTRSIQKSEDINRRRLELERKLMEIEKKRIQMFGQIDQITLLINRLRLIFRFSTVGLILGIILTIAGFYFWYIKVQRYQDMMIKKESGADLSISSPTDTKS